LWSVVRYKTADCSLRKPQRKAAFTRLFLCPTTKQTLNRSERTIRNWLNGTKVIPPCAVAVPRLQALEYELRFDQMGCGRQNNELEVH
jgi:hypothetical protein